MPQYFIGKNVASRTLAASDAITFQDLVKRQIDLPVILPLTYAQYHALNEIEQRTAKLCPYIVACTFPSTPWEGRVLEHAGACNLIFLDIDVLKDGTCPAAQYVANSRYLIDQLAAFNFVAYKTASATPEKPRLRIVVDAKGIPADRYPDAVLSVAQQIGLSHVTRESAIAVQPMFRPCVFSDQDADLDHPIIASSYAGRPFEVSDIAEDLDSLPGFVSSNKKPSTVKLTGNPLEDFLAFYQAPIPQITLQVAGDALAFVSPDVSRPEWVEIGAALKHQFYSDEAEAYRVFDTWSAQGSKYAGQKDTTTNWKSLHEQPKGRAPITIRTLLKRALEGGWDGSKVKEECYQSAAEWIQFKASTATELMAEGVRRIAALPMSSQVEEEALLQILAVSLKDRFETRISLGPLRKDLKAQKLAAQNAGRETGDKQEVPPWARYFIYVAVVEKFFRHTTGQTFTRQSFNDVFGRRLLPSADDLKKADLTVSPATLNRPMFLPHEYLLNHLQCQTADDFTYDPSAPEETIVTLEGKRFVNTYRPSYARADGANAWDAEAVIMNHMANLIEQPEYMWIVLDWLAYIVQNPGAKIRWAIVLQGAEGCGKTLIAEMMRAVLGPGNVSIVDKESVCSAYNDWATGVQFIAVEEIKVAGHNRHDVMNKLKQIVTNTHLPIHERYRADRVVPNRANLLVLTNHHDALVVTANNRRYFILKSRLQTKAQVVQLRDNDPDYFNRIYQVIEHKQAGLRYFLENYQNSPGFDPDGHAPETVYLKEMVADTSSELSVNLLRVFEDGDCPLVKNDVLAATTLLNLLQLDSGLGHISPQYLAAGLREMGMTKVEGRFRINGERQYVWHRPELTKGQDPLDILNKRLYTPTPKDDESL